MRGGTSGSEVELSWEEEPTGLVSVDINLLKKGGTGAEACWNEASLELPSTDAKPLLDSNLLNASDRENVLVCIRNYDKSIHP